VTELAVFVGVVFVVITGVLSLRRSIGAERGWAIWEKVARAHLTGIVVADTVTGWADELAVRFEVHVVDGPTNGTRLVVWNPERPIDGLTLRPEPRWRRSDDIELGDPAFDRLYRIDGDSTLAWTLLGVKTRRHLLELARGGRVQIANGQVEIEISNTSRPALSRRLTQVIAVARLLTQPRSVVDRLAEIAARDPQPAMRLRAVSALSREFRQEPAALRALRLACADKSAGVCLEAASAIGPAGRATLLDLAERGARCAPQALDALDGGVSPERVIALLDRAARHGAIELARACLNLLGRIGSDACIAPLVAQLEAPPQTLGAILGTRSDEIAATAAAALGQTGSPRAEPPLIAALARPEMDVRTAVAQALGRVGSVAAVVSLKEAAEASSEGDFRRTVRQAVAEIQSRIGGSPGELSMATAESGQVSLADDRAGGVSVPPADEPKDGR
jgi:HEAT repeat protein